jgi:hypothetical protein
MRGSTTARRMSLTTIPKRIRKLMNMMFARTRLMSSCRTASYIRRPIPGYEKMISRIREPEKSEAKILALEVM